MRRLIQAGLVDKWMDDIMQKSDAEDNPDPVEAYLELLASDSAKVPDGFTIFNLSNDLLTKRNRWKVCIWYSPNQNFVFSLKFVQGKENTNMIYNNDIGCFINDYSMRRFLRYIFWNIYTEKALG